MLQKKNFYIQTFGCQMNVHESEKLDGILRGFDFVKTENIENADIIVFNTCCIRHTAEQTAYGHIGQTKALKKKNKNLIIAVCGCLTQKDGTAEILKKRYPYVDIIFGTHNLHLFGDYLKQYLANNKKAQYLLDSPLDDVNIDENTPTVRTSGTNAWVNIMYGCNNFCTYCIVPYVRGRERSRPLESIVCEVSKAISEGYKTITLLGQNVNSYAYDNANFNTLLQTLAKLDGDFTIKFMTSHPKDFSLDVIKTIAKYDKLSKEIHLPLQAGSNRILQLMNRRYTREQYLDIIKSIKENIKDASISTDIMVGFNTETEEDFLDTLDIVKKVNFSNIYSFVYSVRDGTAAAKMDGQISEDVKKDRIVRLINAK